VKTRAVSQTSSSDYHEKLVRPGALAAVALVSAVLGGTATLVVGKAAGWIDDEPAAVQTVVLPATNGEAAPANDPIPENATKALAGNDADWPKELYGKRAAGVVTIYALFQGHTGGADDTAAQGSGFVVSGAGYILTNSHVITTAGETAPNEEAEAAESVYVQYRDEERVPAEVIGWDIYDDVGVLKVDPLDHPVSPVPLGDSGRVVVGEPVAAIGSPFGQTNSLSVGVVSATERSVDALTSPGYNLVDAIQTDAPINRGNSGGPLFNARGEVIGINAQIRSESGNAEGVGFAVPINAAKRSMAQLVEKGRVRYAWLGVTTRTVTPRLAEHFGFGAARGAAIQTVVPRSPAAKAGLLGGGKAALFEGVSFMPGGDLIIAVDGRRIERSEDVVRLVTRRLPGQRVRLTIARGSERRVLSIVLGARPATPPQTGR
jgi:S1-C subfamily serine protease